MRASSLQQLEQIPEVAPVKAWDEKPRDSIFLEMTNWRWSFGIYQVQGDLLNNPGSEVACRAFRWTITPYLPRTLLKETNLSRYLCSWQSLYAAVYKLALTNLVHRDLSFENLRLLTDYYRIQLIDFDLANEIDLAGTEGKARPRNPPDRTARKFLCL